MLTGRKNRPVPKPRKIGSKIFNGDRVPCFVRRYRTGEHAWMRAVFFVTAMRIGQARSKTARVNVSDTVSIKRNGNQSVRLRWGNSRSRRYTYNVDRVPPSRVLHSEKQRSISRVYAHAYIYIHVRLIRSYYQVIFFVEKPIRFAFRRFHPFERALRDHDKRVSGFDRDTIALSGLECVTARPMFIRSGPPVTSPVSFPRDCC